ncbi:MAG: hypothetical protein Q9160_002087 [Pyrenula sp. 1 TL-2023]
MSGIKILLGGGSINSELYFKDEVTTNELLDILKKEGVKRIDTAQLYGDSESILGRANAGKDFIIDTKVPGGFQPGSSAKASIVKTVPESIERLKVDKVDTLYIHAPDQGVPISESLAGINEVYQKGLFSRFGLSNFKAEDVQKVYDHCKEHGYVLPSVYQGNYSPVARKLETILFPTLRKLGISFYAYSPLAGGFLTKTKDEIIAGAGRFNDNVVGGTYRKMYNKPTLLEALAEWDEVAKSAGCSKANLAYRWVTYNSILREEAGDGVIIGARSLEQAQETLEGLKAGPLDKSASERIEQIWKKVEHEAPEDNFNL